MKYIIISFLFIACNVLAEEYLLDLNAKVVNSEVHNYSENSYFNILKLDGSFTDNLGNYGNWDALVSVEIDNAVIKQHFFSTKITYQDDSIVFAQGSRTSEEWAQGVGKFKFVLVPEKLNSLKDTLCIYGLKFLNKTSFTSAKCNISKESLKQLTNLSKK